MTSQASGTREACYTWIVSECKSWSKQMFDSVDFVQSFHSLRQSEDEF